jgi:hypothetical protein
LGMDRPILPRFETVLLETVLLETAFLETGVPFPG